jgi:hypothetical protein
MSAAETIEAAIAKLEAAKVTEDGDEQRWRYEAPNPFGVVSPPAHLFDADDYLIAKAMTVADAETAVMLHRTIDAQLTILRRDIAIRERYSQDGVPIEAWESAVKRAGDLDLARAILGEAS